MTERPAQLKAAWPCLAMMLPGVLAPGAVGLALQDTSQAVSEFPDFVPVGRFGILDGDSTLMFGRLSGLAVDIERGIVFVVDELAHKLSAVTKEGRFLTWAGGRGEGPGELIGPKAVEVSGSEVHVLDAWNHRVTRYDMGSATLRYMDQTRLPTSGGWEFCLFDGDYLILKHEHTLGGRTIHRFDRAGNVKSSFGVPFLEGDAAMLNLTDVGLLACDPANRRVYAASTAVPRVHGYSGDGNLLWTTELPGVEGAVIERTATGVKWSLPEGKSTFGSVVTFSIIPQGHLLVQYEEQEWEQGVGYGPVVGSFLIDAASGAILATSEYGELPRISTFGGGYAYGTVAAPVPEVRVYEWRQRGRQ